MRLSALLSLLAALAVSAAGACATSPPAGFGVMLPGIDASADDGSSFGGSSSSGGVFTDASFVVDAPVLTGGNGNDFTSPVLDVGVPPTTPRLFAAADQGMTGPCLYEPEMGSLFPNNWLPLRFRFTTSNMENMFEIKLTI